MSKIAFILLVLCSLLISCKNQYTEKPIGHDYNSVEKYNKYFEGFPQLQIDQKYFNALFIHKSFRNMDSYFDFKYERFLDNSVETNWVRTYILGNKAYKEFRYFLPDDNSNNLLIINENRKCAFVKWRNAVGKNNKFFTGNLDETTEYIETNLPAVIINKFYSGVRCKINEVHPDSISVNLTGLGPYYTPHLVVE